VALKATVAAWLDETPADPNTEVEGYGWHLERARLGTSRSVPLEVVLNGNAVERAVVLADGQPRTATLEVNIERSNWRFSSCRPLTGPIVVRVAGHPVRASRRSAEWCLGCLEVVWAKHAHRIRESERAVAAAAWDHARASYRQTSTNAKSRKRHPCWLSGRLTPVELITAVFSVRIEQGRWPGPDGRQLERHADP
jgi:hypothetical protein